MYKIKFVFLNSTTLPEFWERIEKRFRPDEYTEISLLEYWQKHGDFAALDNKDFISTNEVPFFIAHSWGNCFILRHLLTKPYKKAYAMLLEPEDFPISEDAKKSLQTLRRMEKIHLVSYLCQMYRQICPESSFVTRLLHSVRNNENFIKACVYEATGILLNPELTTNTFLLPYIISAGFADYGAGDNFFEKRIGDFPLSAHRNFQLIRFYHCEHFCFNGPGEDILIAAIAGAIRKHEVL